MLFLMQRHLLFFILLSTVLAHGQVQEFGRQRHEFSTRNGVSFGTGHVFGFAQDRKFYTMAFRYGFRFRTIKGVTLRYTAEAVPVAVLGEPYFEGRPILGSPIQDTEWQYIYGGGLNPIGIQMNFRSGKRLQPVLDSNGGFLYFTQRVLSPEASQFNFTVHVGLGVQIFSSERHAITAAFRYHHLSNANISQRNPGTDALMLDLRFSWFR